MMINFNTVCALFITLVTLAPFQGRTRENLILKCKCGERWRVSIQAYVQTSRLLNVTFRLHA